MPDRVPVEVDGRVISLSHLDKILWPATGSFPGWTKGEALHYLAQVAAAMIPHVRRRPASFVRFPDGITGPRFYSKNLPPGLPDWVPTADVPGKEGSKPHVTLDDTASLMAMANLYGLEIHVPQWNADTGPGQHDRLVIDLDPGDGVDVTDCCRIALLVRERLADDGLAAWVKTSGAKGLHLYAPIRDASGDQATAYARTLALRLADEYPDAVVARMTKALRPGKTFLDFSQNATSKTTAAPYSLRATPTPGVSTPVTWEEIERCTDAAQLAFTPDQVLARVAEHGDLLAGLLDSGAARGLP